ncbi:hypothetical protein SERLA73DRAFT_170414 [Serpula lacrymans var. lacrymans S7.3]|uniref:Telomere length regulation protein conserved domain-containing protein n=2 Tax=Serpula lacrymans var. lacrymans TaxID=341189 RepID=F8Q5T6_SERL3|nr:uncharacterized protein SERLADRAFT_451532 [Serpula lacrymans var. lacrymans S7.9]EGN95974.1 hypothetical protein SERLA73DRAFT_170414 [Serpula lacrymans var. lacrymans S7.3]EGO21499.1 hypothetical protein SERLADRAFT_451532 [Serpula lacrymans var. lacrymans S7.9]
MSAEFLDSSLTQIKDVINKLQVSVTELPTLLSLLCAPLDSLGLLPPQYRRYNLHPLTSCTLNASRHIPPIQRALLQHVIPTWEAVLVEEKLISLVEQYFCPDAFSNALPAAGEIALLAYSTILSLSLTEQSIQLLCRLSKGFPIDRLHRAVFSGSTSSERQSLAWGDCLRNVFSVPAKVANALKGKDLPPGLDHATYFNNLSLRCEVLVNASSSAPLQETGTSVCQLLAKLVNVGVFPPTQPTTPSQPSFFYVTLPTIRSRLENDTPGQYSAFWNDIIRFIPSVLTQQAILTSLLSSLSRPPTSLLSPLSVDRGIVKREAILLRGVVGRFEPQSEVWNSILAIAFGREWNEFHARILVCWAAQALLVTLLEKVLERWGTPDHVKHSLLSRHHYLAALLLLCVSYFPPSSPQVSSIAISSSFISGIGLYISHNDNSVRRCGMLVAEVVAKRAGKQLDFGDWDGEGDGRPWARDIRTLIAGLDMDADVKVEQNLPSSHSSETSGDHHTMDNHEDVVTAKLPKSKKPIQIDTGYDSDDSLTGYASPSSSRSVSPTPSELEEIEKDPTLRVGVKKIPQPVYLVQLGTMVRGTVGLKTGEDTQEVDKLEVALTCAEELIRRKRNYGSELEENAPNLVYGFVGLQDNYDLDDFDNKRQRAVNALVACCPRIAAPSIIEEFFKNQYSTEQRYVMLNALALGARELASLPIFSSALQPVSNSRTAFPSKVLPPALHERYIAAASQGGGVVQQMLDGITRKAMDRGSEGVADKVPQLVRERQLRIRKPAKVTEVMPNAPAPLIPNPPQDTTFTEVAAEFFIVPFINRFWLFLRDEQAREERTALRETLHQYRGAGTGLILNPVVLAHFLSTLAILVHAAQNASQWLAIVAPEALELAVTLGTRPLSRIDEEVGDHAGETQNDAKAKEASVLTAALELALIVLDGCLELDGGRSMGLEHTALLFGTEEWAGKVFSHLEKGVLVEGGGGAHEIKLKRAAAGVLLKVEELSSKWRRSMVDIR